MLYNDGGIGFQLSMYRWMDGAEKVREIREQTAAASSMASLVCQYNQLVGRFNRLWNGCLEAGNEFERCKSEAKRQIEERDARIADLERQLAAAKATEQRLRAHTYNMAILRLDQEREREQREASRSQQG